MKAKHMVLILVLLLVSFFLYKIFTMVNAKSEQEKRIQTLPAFCFEHIHSGTYCSTDLPENSSCVIFYFHPECEHCQYEAEQVVLHQPEFKNVTLLWISVAPLEQLREFEKNYHLGEFDNILILHDKKGDFQKNFGARVIPTSFIYKNRNLRKKFDGEVKIEAILTHLHESHE